MAHASDTALALSGTLPPSSRARVWAFHVLLVVAILLLALPMLPFLVVPVGWPWLSEQLGVHQLHDVGVGTMLWLMLTGLIVQTRHAHRRAAGLQQSMLAILLLLAATAITRPSTLLSPLLIPFGLVFAVGALHPARSELVRIRRHIDPVLAALALLSAGPLLLYASQQLRLDADWIPLAAHGGHWTAMGTVAAVIVVLALLAAARTPGWRIPAWSAGVAAIILGTASAGLPHRPSSVGLAWSALAVVWGIAFIVISEIRARALGGTAVR